MKNKFLLLALLGVFCSLGRSSATIVYVDASHIGGSQNGGSWAGAFSNFQSGVNAAAAGDSVWVAQGIYTPFALQTFSMKEGVKIFGGFLNTHTSFAQRNPDLYVARLQGNSTKVMNNPAGLSPAALLDGVTIAGGGNTTEGGGIANSNCSPTIRKCHITGNGAAFGGGIFNNGIAGQTMAPQIDSCVFDGNGASFGGGAIYNSNASPVITNCIFNNNTRGLNVDGIAGGGAIYNYHSWVIIGKCTFTNNSTNGGDMISAGGAIYNDHSTAIISMCSFSTNHVISRQGMNSYYGYGGAIYSLESAMQVSSCSFTGNNAASAGGAIYINNNNTDSASVISGCTFNGNKITSPYAFNKNLGGGMYIENATASVQVKDCSFTGNRAPVDGMGGGMYLNAASPRLINDTFTANTAQYGGGIFSASASSPEIRNTIFASDTATHSGGALFDSLASPVLINCLIHSNVADSFGGAVYNYSASLKTFNTTISWNTAFSGGSFYNLESSAPHIVNSIVWGNNSDFVNDAGSLPVMHYSLVQGYPADAATHNIDGVTDPLFTDAATGDYQLLAGSPCIDMGNNDSIPQGVTTDLAAHARIFSNAVDLGAYEKPLPPSVSIGTDTIICTGSSLLLDAGNPGAVYLWNTGDTTRTITVDTAGTYTVIATDSMGADTASITITISELPVVQLGNDTTVATGTILTLDAGNAGATYLWNTGAGTQSISVSTAGTYSVNVTNAAHCSSSDTIKVKYQETGVHQVVPEHLRSAISPNPSSDFVVLHIQDQQLLSSDALLTDFTGRTVVIAIKSRQQTISLAGFSAGVYVLKLKNGETFSIVKE